MAGPSRDNALDHVVVVVFENRSLDNVLGRLYGPGDGKTFEGVIGKDLTNPIPERAHNFLAIQFPLLHPAAPGPAPRPDPGVRQP
jgi:phospholipase C